MICELSIFSSLPSRPSRLRGSFKKTSSSQPAEDCYITYPIASPPPRHCKTSLYKSKLP